MDKCVLIPSTGWEKRIRTAHPLLTRIPERIGRRWASRIPCELFKTITHEGMDEEIGYVVDIPYFFDNKGEGNNIRRRKNFFRLVDLLQDLNTMWICMESPQEVFFPEELETLMDEGISFPSGEQLRTACLFDLFPKMVSIMGKKTESFESVILGADSIEGEDWAHYLSPMLNRLTLQGEDRRILLQMSHAIMTQTGLAAEVVQDIDSAIKDKQLVILAKPGYEDSISYKEPDLMIFRAYIKDGLFFKDEFLDGRGIILPAGLHTGVELTVLEKLQLAEVFLLSLSDDYQKMNRKKRMNALMAREILNMMDHHGFLLRGMTKGSREYSFDEFRKWYYVNNS